MIAKGILCALLAGISADQRAATVEAGFWDIWTDWNNCTALCGPGTRNRTRECVDETGSGEDELLQQGEHVDLQCVGGDTNGTDTESCQLAFCPDWGTWAEWSSCSVTCAGGSQGRSRTCMEGPEVAANQADCPGNSTDSQVCNTGKCPEWAEWGAWSACDAECNGGNRVRVRDCTDAAKHRTYFQTMMLKLMGREDLICDGIDSQSETCNTISCVSPCGNINTAPFYAALGDTVRSTIECKHNAFCTLLCIDQGQVPVVQPTGSDTLWDGQIDCVVTNWTLSAVNQAYVCQDLACNAIVDFVSAVAGGTTANVQELCADNDCPLNCTNQAFFPQPAASINCGNWDQHLTHLSNHGIDCTESQCGNVDHSSWMTGSIQTLFNYACDATNCDFTCSNAEKVPYIGLSSWDGQVACTQPSNVTHDWDGSEIATAGCARLPCAPYYSPSNVTATAGASMACAGGSCAVVCQNSQYPSPAAVDCTNFNTVSTITCTELSCGDITDILATYTLGAGVNRTCDSAADSCAFTCTDTNLAPYPAAAVTCDDPSTPNPSGGTSIKCAKTACGDENDWNYGAGFSDVSSTCDGSTGTCDLSCATTPGKTFPHPVTQVQCTNNVLTPSSGTNIVCAETPCGTLSDTFSVLDAVATCDTTGCTFTCADTSKMPSFASVTCSGTTYTHAHGSDSQDIECVTKMDTPCGDVSSEFSYSPADVNITCAALESVYQTTATCAARCIDTAKVLVGDSTLTCNGGAFTNTDKTLACKDTACGDLSDKWTVTAGVSYTCDGNGLCTFTCDDSSQVPNAASVQCTNTAFDDLVIFNGQLTNPNIICEAPADTYCGDTSQFTSVPADTSFACDSNTQVCNVVCDQAVYGTEVQSAPATVTCNVNTRQFNEALDTAFECQLYDVSCGNLADNYNISSSVQSNCVKFNSKRANLDVCTLSCTDTSLFVTVTDTISCDVDTLQFVDANDTAISCEETKCGNPDTWNFGADFATMTKTCDPKNTGNIDCVLSCSIGTDAGFVLDVDGNSFSTVVCQADRVLLPAEGAVSLSCAETPCGKLSTNTNINPAVTATCDAAGCTFACPVNGTMPSYSALTCGNSGYNHVDGSDINPIECVAAQDTPCGDVSSTFTYDAAEVNLNCDAFNSIHQNAAMTCSPTCIDPTKILITDSTLTCENKAFTNTNLNIWCKSTTCGDVTDKFTVAAGVSHTCDTGTGICSFTCDVVGELPLVNQVTCNAQTNVFDDVTLWPTTPNPVLNPTIICEVRDEVPCGNAADFTNLGNGTVVTCDYASSTCSLSCDSSVPTHSQPNVDVIDCNPITQQFSHALDFEFNCKKYDVTCGDIADSFTVIPGVNIDCSYYEARNQKLDICSLSCNDTTLVPSPITEIVCDQDTEQFLTTVQQTIECIPPPETSCGYISDSYIVDASAGVAQCDGNACWFTCANPTDYAHISLVTCTGSGYFPAGGTISCQSGFDTACGNIDVTSNSAKNCTNNVCDYSCSAGQFLHGVTQATCTVVNGTKTVTTVENLYSGEDSSTVSTCGDTMCGDLTNLGVTIDADVIVNASLIGVNGYGSIQLDCPTTDLVISGLRGQSAVACLPNGQFDVVDASATIGCSETTCGDVVDALAVDAAIVTSCSGDSCSFTCDIPDADTVDPTMSQLICQTSTGKFLTGNHNSIRCIVGCDDFGPETGFILDEFVHQDCNGVAVSYSDNEQYCDLVCRKQGRPGKPVLPTVRETGQSLNKIFCHKVGTNDGVWKSVVYNQYGVPILTTIKANPTFGAVRHLVCDEDLEIEQAEEEECVDVRENYDINDNNMVMRCTPEACIFLCEPGFRLMDNNPSVVTCKIRHSDQWTPIYHREIRCIENTVTVDEGGSGCGSLSVDKESTVNQKCSGNTCTFSCTDGGNPSVSEINCENGKWRIPKDAKKKGIKCDGGDSQEDAGCGEFTAFESGVVPSCDEKVCTFKCEDDGLSANVKKAKCSTKKGKAKWDLGKKGPKKVSCSDGSEVESAGCGDASFDDTVNAECDEKSCTFTCVDDTLTPNSLTATCGKKNKWSYDDKKVSSVTCSASDDSGDDAGPPHKCDMNAFAGVALDQCSDAKVSTCTVSCTDETMAPDAATVDCKKGKWNIDVITCA